MLYFIVHNNTLVLFKKNPEKDTLNLHSKIKFHHPLLSCINDSKILNNVISQALDELNEKELLENQDASIIINDTLLSHSLVINSGTSDSELTQKIMMNFKQNGRIYLIIIFIYQKIKNHQRKLSMLSRLIII